jgi:hypothetical protein
MDKKFEKDIFKVIVSTEIIQLQKDIFECEDQMEFLQRKIEFKMEMLKTWEDLGKFDK